jgi:hypothetical protein
MEVITMRPIIFALLALALLPSLLTGCGTNLPDTLVVTMYAVSPGTTPSTPYDIVFQDPYDVAAPQYLLQRWQNTDVLLVQRLYDDVSHFPTDPGGHGGSLICFGYWYLIAFQQAGQTLAFIRLSECPISGVVLNDKRLVITDTTFWHILKVDMNIPIQW